MRPRHLIPSLLLLAFAIAAPSRAAAGAPAADDLPEHVLYGQMFRHVVALEQQAEALEKRGEDGGKLRLRYQQSAELSDRQDETLKAIARDCVARVAEQDRKAVAIIQAARARIPDGILAAGQAPPVAPPELAELQKERNALILEFRDQLRYAFGEEEFQRLDTFARQSIGPHIRRISPEQRPHVRSRH